MGDFWFLFIMAVLVFCTGWGAYKLIMLGQVAVYAVLFCVLGGVGLYLGAQARGSQGWDAIGYFAFLVIFIAPTLGGMVVGGLVGVLKRRRGS